MANRRWVGCQIDFKSTFLNSKLKKPIYMEQAQGYEDPEHPDWVYEVKKAIYSLKQSPRLWNKELHALLTSCGLVQYRYNPTLYYCLKKGHLVAAVTAHVNDLCLVGERDFVAEITKVLHSRFEVGADKDLNHFLSI